MGVVEESEESVKSENVRDDNKHLQMKVERNEKLIQHLQWEQTHHGDVLKVSGLRTRERVDRQHNLQRRG